MIHKLSVDKYVDMKALRPKVWVSNIGAQGLKKED